MYNFGTISVMFLYVRCMTSFETKVSLTITFLFELKMISLKEQIVCNSISFEKKIWGSLDHQCKKTCSIKSASCVQS